MCFIELILYDLCLGMLSIQYYIISYGMLHIITNAEEGWDINTLRPRQHGCHFVDNIFKCIFLNENVSISIKISLKFVCEVRINNIPASVQMMAWRRPGDKPLSETMMVSLLTQPQCVKLIKDIPYLTISFGKHSIFHPPLLEKHFCFLNIFCLE